MNVEKDINVIFLKKKPAVQHVLQVGNNIRQVLVTFVFKINRIVGICASKGKFGVVKRPPVELHDVEDKWIAIVVFTEFECAQADGKDLGDVARQLTDAKLDAQFVCIKVDDVVAYCNFFLFLFLFFLFDFADGQSGGGVKTELLADEKIRHFVFNMRIF